MSARRKPGIALSVFLCVRRISAVAGYGPETMNVARRSVDSVRTFGVMSGVVRVAQKKHPQARLIYQLNSMETEHEFRRSEQAQ